MNHACLHAVLVACALTVSTGPDKVQIVVAPGGAAPVPAPAPQPSPIPTSVKLAGAEFKILTLQGYTGTGVTWDVSSPDSFAIPVKLIRLKPRETIVGIRAGSTVADRHESPETPSVAVWATNSGTATVSAWGVQMGKPVKLATFRVDAGQAPRPPPKPDPDPKPPEPVTSYRVFLVYEAGATLTAEQYGVLYGVEVENALKAACNIPNASAWRRLDKDANPASLPAGLKEAWTAAKPAVTAVPCIAFQVNQKITIEALPVKTADATAMIAKYREGK